MDLTFQDGKTWMDVKIVSAEATSLDSRRLGRGWVQGNVFIHEDNRLNATYRDAPLSGRVIPAGEYRFTDSNGAVHVMAAYGLY